MLISRKILENAAFFSLCRITHGAVLATFLGSVTKYPTTPFMEGGICFGLWLEEHGPLWLEGVEEQANGP